MPLLVADGHVVAGMTRSPNKAKQLRRLGAEPVVCDVFDAETLRRIIVKFNPDVVIHQLTDLPDDASQITEHLAGNERIRREGTLSLLAAAAAAPRESRFIAQSIAWNLDGVRGAVADLETAVLKAGGTVIRYGQFYGPGTYYIDSLPEGPRINIEEAARQTMLALTAAPGILVAADDN